MRRIGPKSFKLQFSTDAHAVDLRIGRVIFDDPRQEYAYVKVGGAYRSPKAEAYNPIRMAVHGSLFWTGRAVTSGLVVDLTELIYTSGDRLLGCFRGPVIRDCVGDRIAIIWAPHNEPHIRSLIEEEEDLTILARCHDSLEACLESIMGPSTGA